MNEPSIIARIGAAAYAVRKAGHRPLRVRLNRAAEYELFTCEEFLREDNLEVSSYRDRPIWGIPWTMIDDGNSDPQFFVVSEPEN